MSMATEATNARQRATIAVNIIKNNNNIFTRSFDDCFEMNDGNEVMNYIIEKVRRDKKLAMAILNKCPSLGEGSYNIRLHKAIEKWHINM